MFKINSQKVYTVDEAQKKLEQYCTYQERCHKEVRAKLTKMKMIPEAIDKIMVYLIQHNYLNEERYAKAFVRGKFRIKKWGKNRLIRELRFKDVSKYTIDLALKEIDSESYLYTLNQLVDKCINKIKEKDTNKKKKKIADYLLYRGWESQLVYDRINKLIN